ncbi:hypothetical protein, partial [Burkholderia semiarida]|uniref:hypothetical protein n=1 Tax=Burkholderia semiarida TaxID=2843303 RepID=UPI0023DDF812
VVCITHENPTCLVLLRRSPVLQPARRIDQLRCSTLCGESNLSRLATQVTGTSTGAPHRSASLLDALRGMLVGAEALTIIDKADLL